MDARLVHAARSSGVCALATAAVALLACDGARAAVAPQITSGPSIAGTAQVGAELTATGTWSGDPAPDATWRWLRCAKDADTCSAIGSATTATYRPTAADVGALLRVRLTVRNSAGSDQERSAPTAAVVPAPVATPTPAPSVTPIPSVTPTPTPSATATPAPGVEPEATPAPELPATFDVVETYAPQPPSPTSSPAATRATPPRLLKPFPVIRIRGLLIPSGARVTLLSVRAPRGVRIFVRCRGGGCPIKRFTPRPGVRRLRPFERDLPSGTRLEITVSKPGFISKRTVFVIRRGAAPTRSDRCLVPDTQRLMECPSR